METDLKNSPEEELPLPVKDTEVEEATHESITKSDSESIVPVSYTSPDTLAKYDHLNNPGTTQLLACEGCYIAERCPKYTQGSTCAYSFQVLDDALSDDQVAKAGIKYLVQAAMARLNRGLMFEDADGGSLDANMSREIANTAKLIEIAQKIHDSSDGSSVSITAKGAEGTSVLEKMFSKKPDPDLKVVQESVVQDIKDAATDAESE